MLDLLLAQSLQAGQRDPVVLAIVAGVLLSLLAIVVSLRIAGRMRALSNAEEPAERDDGSEEDVADGPPNL